MSNTQNVYTVLYRNGNYEDDQSTVVGVFSSLERAKEVGKVFLEKEEESDTDGYHGRGQLNIIKTKIDALTLENVSTWEIDKEKDMVPLEYLSDYNKNVYEN